MLPSAAPRPDHEEVRLRSIWDAPRGLAFVTVVNNNYIGVFYVGAAFLFFLLAGLLALAMRTQLAVPNNDLVGPGLYNQLFTMHGTIMMFLFAVPAVEAMGVLLLPGMVGARDLPFPRLSAYAFWAYLIGGLVFFGSLFFGLAPDGGWFMYPPLTSGKFSPGINADFWLLGIGFIEISAIAGAIEIIVGVLRTRAPGMSLERMPMFAWAMLVFALMIVFAFPAVIVATALLELERAFGWPFFDPELGGDPLLWQHLFWFFGHPEVYLIFLPAAGMVSMMIPTVAQAPLVAHRLVILALVGTGFLRFGLWVHHMFATGIPRLSLSFFSAASMAVAVPTGIQVFAWIATLARGRVRMSTPALFILGFLFTFVAGGLTGVMVAVVPFDWQAHDTYFIVAHLHYVLIGGMVFPLLAAFYYWMPFTSRHRLSERIGRWVFALVFSGFHLAFFPMHVSGLLGMPRRVYTYPAGLGWDAFNLVSTVGAFLIAGGVALLLFDLARRFRMTPGAEHGNVWNASSLEWLPSESYGVRSIPRVESRDPLWDQPGLFREVGEGRHYLPDAPTGGRETLLTSALDAVPQALLRITGASWWPLVGAVGTAGFFLLLTVKWVATAAVFGIVALIAIVRWAWDTDPEPTPAAIDVGGGLRLPAYVSGPSSHSWWAMVVLLLVAGSIYGCVVFAYLYLWTVRPEQWPDPSTLSSLIVPVAACVLFAASSAGIGLARRALERKRQWTTRWAMAGSLVVLLVAFGLLLDDLLGGPLRVVPLADPLPPDTSGYAAVVWLNAASGGVVIAAASAMALYTLARSFAGRLDCVRRVTFDNTRLLWHYAAAQNIAGLVLVHGFPRWVG